jgi:hypothetical protein
LTVDTGITLTLNGPFEAGLYQVFSCTGTGSVVFGSGSYRETYPEWCGAIINERTYLEEKEQRICYNSTKWK